jgi:integrase
MADHRTMYKTNTPGIYRRGKRYVAVVQLPGRKQKRISARTKAEAIKKKAMLVGDSARGDLSDPSPMPFVEYASEWVERYVGRGRGFRDSTRANYRSDLKRAYEFFGERKRLCDVTPRDLANLVAWLMDEQVQGKALSDATIANCVKPVRALFGSAVDEGLLRHNPTVNVRLPRRPKIEDDDESEGHDARALSRDQLAAVVELIHPKHRLLVEFLATTGIRIGELLPLRWQDCDLDGGRPHIRIRREWYRGKLSALKTKYARREVPIPSSMAAKLCQRRAESKWNGDEDLVFPNEAGRPHNPENLRRRHLRPVMAEAGAEWASFHSLRHSCASMLFERGANAVEVQHRLGHHSAAFTMARYVHMLKQDDLGEPIDLGEELATAPQGDKQVTSKAEEIPSARVPVAIPA